MRVLEMDDLPLGVCMTNFQPTHRHKVTGEEFQLRFFHNDLSASVTDGNGECRTFIPNSLEPLAPTEEWANVHDVAINDGVVRVCVDREWVPVTAPSSHPDIRWLDGKILQRRKR